MKSHKKPIHYGWFVCVGCALMLFCTSGITVNAFTVYQPYIMSQNNLTNAQSSAILTVRSLFIFLAMLLAGVYYGHISLRRGLGIAGLLNGLGFVCFGLSKSFAAYCASAAVVGIAYGLGNMIPVSILLEHWFRQKRTLAVSLCYAVTGFATLGIPTVLTNLIESRGLAFTFFVNAAGLMLLGLVTFLLVRDYPKDKGLSPYGAETALLEERKTGSKNMNAMDWCLMLLAVLLTGAVTNPGYSHLTVLMRGQGVDPLAAATGITITGVFLIVGKLLYGGLSEVLPARKSNWLFAGLMALGFGFCALSGGKHLPLFIGLALYGISLSVTTVGLTAWAGDLSTGDTYDTVIRRFNVGYAAGGMLFSTLPGILADRANGSYVPAYLMFAAFTLILVGLVQIVYRRMDRRC